MASFYYKAYRSLYSVVRFGARFAVFGITGLALLGAFVVGLTQLEAFRGWAINKGLEALNAELQGKVTVGDVSGNFITGLNLLDVRLQADSTSVIEAPLVELTYQLEPIFEDKVIGARATIHNPTIRLIRNRVDSVWNFERITKPATDSIKTPFNMSIDLAAFEIVNAKVYVHDLTTPRVVDTNHHVNFRWLELERMNLALQAHIAPTAQSVWIQHLSFDAPQPDIRLIELAGNISIDTTGLTVKDMNIETSRSLLAFNGHIDSLNVLGTGKAMNSWEQYPLELDLKAERVSTLEIRRFAPDVNFLAGSPSLDLSVTGLLSDLEVRRLDIGMTHGNISAAGRVRNLDQPDSLWIDADLKNTLLTYRDVPLYVPGLGLPDLAYLGDVEIRSGSFTGYTNEFITTLDAKTATGSVRGGARLDLRTPVMGYAADLAVADLDLAPIVGDRTLASNLTGRVVLNGRGTSLEEIDSRFRIESQASTIAGRSYRKLYAGGRFYDQSIIDADTILVAWGEGGTTSDGGANVDLDRLPQLLAYGMENALESQLALDAADRQIFATSASMLGAGGVLDIDRESYKVSASGRNFDPSRLTLDRSQQSSLSFYAEVDGRGFDPDAISGNAFASVTDASVSGRRIPPFQARVTLEQDGGENRTLLLRSDIADADVTGRWRFETIVPAITQGIEGFSSYIGRKAAHRSESMYGMGGRALVPINAEYSLTLKNLAPLQLFLPGTTISAEGTVSGEIAGTGQTINLTVNADLKRFFYSADGMKINLPATRATIDLQNVTPGHIEDLTTAVVSIESDSLVSFNDLIFTVPDVDLRLENGEFRLHGATAINNAVTLAVDGVIDVRDPGGYRVRLDTLLVGIPNGPQFHNLRPVSALVSGEQVRIDTLVMQRDLFEVVSVTGALVGDRLKDVVVEIEQGSLRSISSFAGGGSALETLGGNLREGTVKLNGPFEDPIIDVSLEIDSLSFSGNVIGDFRTDLYYMDQNLKGKITVLDVRTAGDSTVTLAEIDIGLLPVDLALASRSERLLSGRPVEITAETNNLPIAFASAFLPGVRFLDGTADLKFSIGGNNPNLTYSGDGAIRRGRMLVEANNVTYFMNAGLKFENELLSIQRLSLRNDPRDLVNSGALIEGTVRFDGLEPKSVDFTADIERLLVLSDATQAVNSMVYGDLVIATGERNISFSGPLTGPLLRGDVIVLNGNLTLPQGEQAQSQSGVVKYVEYTDWIALTERPFGPATPFDDDPSEIDSALVDSVRSGSLVAASRGLQGIIDSVQGRSTGSEGDMIDMMELDLRIFIAGRLFARVDFSPIEQLRAEIGDGGSPIQITRQRNKELSIAGTLVLMEGSDFTFIKKFDADGYITFRENIETPDFDITARHENRRLLEGGSSQEYEVIARIKGTTERPDLSLDYTIDNRPSSDATSDQKQRNAIALLLFGRTSEELAGSGVGGHASTLIGSVAGSGSSSLLSSVLNEAFTTTGFIRSLDVDLGGNPADISQARLNTVLQFGKIIVRYGGQVSAPSNGIITVDVPFALYTDIAFLRDFSLQFQRELQSISSSNTNGAALSTTETETIRFRLQYRTTW